jgi:hypothetical protein
MGTRQKVSCTENEPYLLKIKFAPCGNRTRHLGVTRPARQSFLKQCREREREREREEEEEGRNRKMQYF